MAGEARSSLQAGGAPDPRRPSGYPTTAARGYVNQAEGGKAAGARRRRAGDGERQAGEWSADRLNGLGTVEIADDVRYSGQWRDGQSTGLGARDAGQASAARAISSTAVFGGPGVRRTPTAPNIPNPANFAPANRKARASAGVEGERYEGNVLPTVDATARRVSPRPTGAR